MGQFLASSSYAMRLARLWHKQQKRKYTGDPYFIHLAEVAAITSTVFMGQLIQDDAVSVAWLHDAVEDQGVSESQLYDCGFSQNVVSGVLALSDLEEGNRATRKAFQRERLSRSPGWIQTIKCADLLSNLSSIVFHDPQFARVYVKEATALVYVLVLANKELKDLLKQELKDADTVLNSK